MLQQTHAGATVFSRKGEDWLAGPVSGEGAMLRMPEISIEIPRAELYLNASLDAG